MKNFSDFGALLACITLHCALHGMSNETMSQPATQKEKLLSTLNAFKHTVSLSDRYQWAEKITHYEKSLFSTGKPQRYYELVQGQIESINKNISTVLSQIDHKLAKDHSATPLVFGCMSALCGAAQWHYKSHLSYSKLSGLAFLSGALAMRSAISLYSNHVIVQKLHRSKKQLVELQEKLTTWLNEEITLNNQESEETGSETEETGSDTEEEC